MLQPPPSPASLDPTSVGNYVGARTPILDVARLATLNSVTLLLMWSACGGWGQPAPAISNLEETEAGLIRFAVNTGAAGVVAIEHSRDLHRWIPVTTEITVDGSYQYVETSDWGQGSRFYRARFGPAATVDEIEYHGWPGSLRMSNGVIEVVVVPAIGRIMHMRFLGDGDGDGPFWENRSLDGSAGTRTRSEWTAKRCCGSGPT